MGGMVMKTLKTSEVDARTLRVGDLIDRGFGGVPLVRMVVRVRQASMALPIEGAPSVLVTEVLHRKLDKTDTAQVNFAHGATCRVLMA